MVITGLASTYLLYLTIAVAFSGVPTENVPQPVWGTVRIQ